MIGLFDLRPSSRQLLPLNELRVLSPVEVDLDRGPCRCAGDAGPTLVTFGTRATSVSSSEATITTAGLPVIAFSQESTSICCWAHAETGKLSVDAGM